MSKKDLKKNQAEETAEKTASDAAEAVAEAASAVKEKAPNVKTGMKKFKYGTMSLIVVALVLAIVIVINLMSSMISKRYPIKFDLTPDKRYELSDESINVLKNLSGDVDVTVTMEKEMFESLANYYKQMYAQYGINADVPYDMIPNLLEKYSMYAEQGKGSVNVKYVDIDKDPDVVAKYKQYYNGDIEGGSIVVYSNEKVKVISGTDVRNMIQADQASLQSGTPNFVFAGESALTSAIRNVTDSNAMKVAFINQLNGQPIYNENEYGAAVTSLRDSLLEKNGYDCEDFDIGTDEFKDGDYDMAVLAVPSYDLAENVITKLSDFLYNEGKYGKNLIYIPSIYTSNLTNLDAFLEDWSLKVENNVIVDDKNAMMRADYIMLNITDDASIGDLPNKSLPIIAPASREVTILSKNNEDVTKSVLSSSDNSFVQDLLSNQADMDNRASHTIVALSTKEHAEQFDTFKSNVLVIGSALMTDETFLAQTNTYNNANALLVVVNNIAPTQGQAKAIRIVVQWIIPAAVAIIGAFVLLRRRNK